MKKNRGLFGLLIILFNLSLFLAYSSAAPPAKKGKQGGDSNGLLSPLGYDVFLLMDVSGSMKRTDPHGYQKLAAKLFVSLLKIEDRIGIITFGDTANVLLPLTPNPRKNKEKIFQAVQKINPNAQFTDLHQAIRLGLLELGKTKRENRILILLSDGKLDLGSREKEKNATSEVSKLWPDFSREKIKIFSIAFTELSDAQFMEDVAQKTGGVFRFAKKASDLPLIFSSLFEKIKAPETTPLTDNTFIIDGSVKEAIVMVAKEPGATIEMSDPGNAKHTNDQHGPNIQWFPTEIFDVVTIQNPTAGSWKIPLSGKEGNRIFILTNLKLKCSFSKNFVEKGETIPLEAFLERDGGIIKEKEVLSQVSFSAEVVFPDKKNRKIALTGKEEGKDPQKKAGIYAANFVADQVGEYTVRILAESKAFKREKNFQFRVQEPPPSDAVLEKTEETTAPTAPSPQPEKKREEDDSWKMLLIKLAVINLLLFSAGGGIYLLFIGGGKDFLKKLRSGKKAKMEEEGKEEKKADPKQEKKEEKRELKKEEMKEEHKKGKGEEKKEEKGKKN